MAFKAAANVWSGKDGNLNAPIIAAGPQDPHILDLNPATNTSGVGATFLVRPPWKVPGVDYPVGIPDSYTQSGGANFPLKDPTLVQPAGTNYEAGGGLLRVTGANVVIDGFDFGLHGGVNILVDTATGTLTVSNCNFLDSYMTQTVTSTITNTVVRNCVFDGNLDANNAGLISIGILLAFNGTMDCRYSLFQNCDHGIDYYDGGPCVARYNYFKRMGIKVSAPASHACTCFWEAGANNLDEFNARWTGTTQVGGVPIGFGEGSREAAGDSGANSPITNAITRYNTYVSGLAGGCSFFIDYGQNVGNGSPNTGGVIHDNYYASINGYNVAGSGAFGPFNDNNGTVVTYSNNIDMPTNTAI
jgi:hypothetical protein